MLLVVVNGTFDHVNRKSFMWKIEALEADRALVRWTGYFMSKRRVSLVVDGQ